MITDRTVLGLVKSFLKPALNCTNCSCRKECEIFQESTPKSRTDMRKKVKMYHSITPNMDKQDIRQMSKLCVRTRIKRLKDLCDVEEALTID